MLLNDTHSGYTSHRDKFVANAFQLTEGRWEGEFIDGYFFQLRYACGLLFVSSGETYYDIGHSVKVIGHDDKHRLKIGLPEILSYLYWQYDPRDIWYT